MIGFITLILQQFNILVEKSTILEYIQRKNIVLIQHFEGDSYWVNSLDISDKDITFVNNYSHKLERKRNDSSPQVPLIDDELKSRTRPILDTMCEQFIVQINFHSDINEQFISMNNVCKGVRKQAIEIECIPKIDQNDTLVVDNSINPVTQTPHLHRGTCETCKELDIGEKGFKVHKKHENGKEFPYVCKWANCGSCFKLKTTRSAHQIKCLAKENPTEVLLSVSIPGKYINKPSEINFDESCIIMKKTNSLRENQVYMNNIQSIFKL